MEHAAWGGRLGATRGPGFETRVAIPRPQPKPKKSAAKLEVNEALKLRGAQALGPRVASKEYCESAFLL